MLPEDRVIQGKVLGTELSKIGVMQLIVEAPDVSRYETRLDMDDDSIGPWATRVGETVHLLVRAKSLKNGKLPDGTFWNYWWGLRSESQEAPSPASPVPPKAPTVNVGGLRSAMSRDESIERQAVLHASQRAAGDFVKMLAEPITSSQYADLVVYLHRRFLPLVQGEALVPETPPAQPKPSSGYDQESMAWESLDREDVRRW